MAKVAVVGVGAIGASLAAGLMVTERHELVLCTRRPLNDLRVETPFGEVWLRAQNITEPSHAEPVDWVLVATKTYDAESTAKWFGRLCGPATRVAIVQNGVEHRERFTRYLAEDVLIPVIIDTPAERRTDGSVWQRGSLQMKVANDAAGRALAELFSTGEVDLVDDFLTAAWQKLCVNATGAVSALLMKPVGVLREEQLGLLALNLVAECVAVGRAVGAKLGDGLGERLLAIDQARPPGSINSMFADRIAGKQTEVDARHGVIVRLGKRYGIPTPANQMAAALITAMSEAST